MRVGSEEFRRFESQKDELEERDMKLSAKITTVTFLAAMALGAATLTGGCTVTSTSSTDTDGGPSSSSGGSSGGSSGTADAGDGSSAATCEGNSGQTYKFPDECQACLEAKCCDKLKSCFGQTPDAGVGCNDYSSCISDCNAKPEAEQDACYEQCDIAVDPAVKVAYEVLATTCMPNNCATECGAQ
jgi:hypothetical protein